MARRAGNIRTPMGRPVMAPAAIVAVPRRQAPKPSAPKPVGAKPRKGKR